MEEIHTGCSYRKDVNTVNFIFYNFKFEFCNFTPFHLYSGSRMAQESDAELPMIADD